jgi:hypothetical protein
VSKKIKYRVLNIVCICWLCVVNVYVVNVCVVNVCVVNVCVVNVCVVDVRKMHGTHSCKWYWTFGSHKIHAIYWLAEDLLASQEGLCPMDLVTSWVIYFI